MLLGHVAESNYAPIEGECLAVTYALDKTKYYTLGLDRLTVCVDHNPLLGILNQEIPLENIENRSSHVFDSELFKSFVI